MSSDNYSSLARIAGENGAAVSCEANLPLHLSDSESVWYVANGSVDVFMIESINGVIQSAPQFVLHADAGRLLFAVAENSDDSTIALIAKGVPGTLLRRLSWTDLAAATPAELANQADRWISEISSMLSRFNLEDTRQQVSLTPDSTHLSLAPGAMITARRGIIWLSNLAPTSCLYLGLLNPSSSQSQPDAELCMLPLARGTWASMTEAQTVSVHETDSLVKEGLLKSSLVYFHEVAINLERLNRGFYLADQVNLARERVISRKTAEDETRHRLFDLYDLAADVKTHSERAVLEEALASIGNHEGIDFNFPKSGDSGELSQLLVNVLDASGVRARQVRLNSADQWWTGASGAMLAFRRESGAPVALVPDQFGRYCEVTSAGRAKTKVTAHRAAALRSDAWVFYQPLAHGSTDLKSLFRVAFQGSAPDFVRLALIGNMVGFMLLLPAILLGYVADEVIPSGGISQLYLIGGMLAVVAVLAALLSLLQKMTLMRVEGRAATRAEAAFWDRLLRLPTKFLRRYSASDLVIRSLTFQTLRDAMESLIVHGLLSIVFLLPTFLVALLYDPTLGLVVTSLALISIAVYALIGICQMAPHHRIVAATHGLASRLFQLINGISVLRLEGAEGSAFAVWARVYREKRLAELDNGVLEAHRQAFNVALPLLMAAVLYWVALNSSSWPASAGEFIVVYMAFIVFITFLVRLGQAFSTLAQILPTVDQIRPLLAQETEFSSEGKSVDQLTGDIRLDRVSFRYDADDPLILNQVSIQVHPGEFIAITGASGAGKSTLFKLMLGLEEPESGAVYYDGQDLKHLNRKQVRRLLGVIPQSVQLHPEDVWDNIAGSQDGLSEQEAWDAARLANVDHEIKAMPMRMMTSVGAGIGVTAGGESQRITIARALNGSARIFLLDEATNWLDNDSQSRVMENLSQLNATQVVIAHRLSTLRHADRIYVLNEGSVVEMGDYSELMKLEGFFFDLVQRQLVQAPDTVCQSAAREDSAPPGR